MGVLIRIVVFGVLLAFGAASAFAHAALIGSEPADGTMTARAPERLFLRFSEPVAPVALSLISGDGSRRTIEDVRAQGNDIVVDRVGDLPAGHYALSWRVVSVDGHPVGGSLLFTVGAAGDAPVAIPADADMSVRSAILALRIAIYLGLFLGIGGFAFGAFIGAEPVAARRVKTTALLVALAALPLSIGFQGLDALGAPFGNLATGEPWSVGFGTSWGIAALLAALATAIALGGSRLPGPERRIAALTSLAILGLALASTGHASAAPPEWLSRPAVFLHAVAIAAWVGALIPLGFALRRREAGAIDALKRFTRFIPFGVAIVVVTGVTLAVLQLGRVDALTTTAYGRVLSIKLALLAALFCLAAVNRQFLTGRVASGDATATLRLTRLIAIEIGLVVAIFATVAFWRFTPPPRSLDAIARAFPELPFFVHIHRETAMTDLTITPARVGPVTVSVLVRKPDLGVLDARGVAITLAQPEAGIEPIRREAKRMGDNWTVEGLILPVAGPWTVTVSVLITDFDEMTFETVAPIGR